MEVIRLDRVSLMRRTQEEFSYNLKKTLLSWLEGKYRQPARRLVLDQVDLAIQAGEKFGIVGANGSGKSTLLKVICNILKPTSGQVRVRGNIAPLIELGAGFDPEISVADNIILYGVMLGFAEKEMRLRTREILEFAELEDYPAVPVKALSSGMVARLGFAIATEVQPDILILDEVLSVGDESFRNKCKRRIERFWHAHSTVLLVSHDLEFIRKSCERAVWLDHGKIRLLGSADDVVDAYIENFRVQEEEEEENEILADEPEIQAEPAPEAVAETVVVPEMVPLAEGVVPPPEELGQAVATRVFVTDQDKHVTPFIPYGEAFYVGLDYDILQPLASLAIGLDLSDEQGNVLLEPVSLNCWLPPGAIGKPGYHRAYIRVPGPLLKPGSYFISAIGLRELDPDPEKITTHHFILKRLVEFSVFVKERDRAEWFGQEAVHPALEWEIESLGER